MSSAPQPVTVYADDPDASITRRITAVPTADLLTFPPKVAVDTGDYVIDATWLGAESRDRELRVPVADLEPGRHRLYLQVPGFNDLALGDVIVRARV